MDGDHRCDDDRRVGAAQNAPMKTAAVILAAGASTRFGSPKQVVRLGGRTMLGHVARAAADAALDPVIAVVTRAVEVPPGVVPVINDDPAAGLSRSLRLGRAAVPAEVDAAVVMLGDQPTITSDTIRAVIAAHRDRPVTAAAADGRLGPPVLIRRPAFELADQAIGDEGLRSFLATRPELVTAVDVGEHVPDVDTPRDLDTIAPATQ
jgi:molybdenum cofactor cytidylyltransferase